MNLVSSYPILTLAVIIYLNTLHPAHCHSADMDKSLTFSKNYPSFSNDFVYCPPGSLINHFTVSWTKDANAKYLTNLNELYFGCYIIPNAPSTKLQFTSLIHSKGTPENCHNKYSTLTHHSSCQFHGFINGYQLYQNGDKILNVRFFCTDETILYSGEVHNYSFRGSSGGAWGAVKKCPFGKAMCGFRTRLHSKNSMEIYNYEFMILHLTNKLKSIIFIF